MHLQLIFCVVTGDQTLDSVSAGTGSEGSSVWILKINPFYMPREPMIKFTPASITKIITALLASKQ